MPKLMENIKILREKTGAGMVNCKKALEESNGDMEKSIEILRKKGIAKAAKRSGRETSEGIILVEVDNDNSKGYILEVNSETDFVSRNDKFKDFSRQVMQLVKDKKPASLDDLLKISMKVGSVKDVMDNLSGIIGEKLSIKSFDILNGVSVSSYSHSGGQIGAIVSFDKKIEKSLAVSIAMQIVASDPKYLDIKNVPIEEIEKEKDIYRELLKKEGKPNKIIDMIVDGKINKYYEKVCLVKQEYIKEDKKNIEDVLGDIKIEKFIRYSL